MEVESAQAPAQINYPDQTKNCLKHNKTFTSFFYFNIIEDKMQ